MAIDAEKSDCIDLLLSHGADTNLGNQETGLDSSPLMDAASAGRTKLVKKLIAALSTTQQPYGHIRRL